MNQTQGAASIERTGPGEFRLSGPLTFETAGTVWRAARELMTGARRITLDLAAVSRTDSAGLALLIECRRFADAQRAALELRNLPAQTLAIAQACHLEDLLGGAGRSLP